MRTDSHFASIDIRGPDALTLLQGQLSADIATLTDESVLLSAWLNPKGRVISLFDVTTFDDGYRLYLPEDLVLAVTRRLTMYKLRSEVTIEPASAAPYLSTIASSGANRAFAEAGVYECFAGEIADEALQDSHLAHRLAAGIPWIDSATTEQYTAHQLNLDWLGAVSFTKGCYSGQEIVARTEHRGRSKRRAQRLQANVDEAPMPGSRVMSGATEIGEVICSARAGDGPVEVLALLPIHPPEQTLTLIDSTPLHAQPVGGWPA